MTTVQWQQIKSILTVALECDSQSERLEFVAVSCRGDIALKAELDALLAQRDHTRCNESFLLRAEGDVTQCLHADWGGTCGR